MSKDMIKKGFLERIPSFSLILIMTVLMVIGAALIPMLRIAYKPTPKQGDELNVSFNWPGASPRVIEQEITSKIEGWSRQWSVSRKRPLPPPTEVEMWQSN